MVAKWLPNGCQFAAHKHRRCREKLFARVAGGAVAGGAVAGGAVAGGAVAGSGQKKKDLAQVPC